MRVLSLFAACVLAAAAGPSAHAASIVVNSAADRAADDGECTLREALTAANTDTASGAAAGECAPGEPPSPATPLDVITFDIAGSGPFVIEPATPLPPVVQPVFIDGYSQRGARPNTLRDGSDAVLLIELRGDVMSPDCDTGGESPVQGGALQFVGNAASGSRVRGLAFSGFQSDSGVVTIFRAGGVQVDGNFIGLDSFGKPGVGGDHGVAVMNGAGELVELEKRTPFDDEGPGNLIGGVAPAERNVISANEVGVGVGGQRNRIEGNYIGVDPQGTTSLPNRADGVVLGSWAVRDCRKPTRAYFFRGDDNVVGGFHAGNFFSAEANNCAVWIGGQRNLIDGNFMGTDRSGGQGPGGLGLGAQPGCGVRLMGSAKDNRVIYNTIAFNSKGIVADEVAGRVPMANDWRANSIHSNVSLGIDLGNDGRTLNDGGDRDTGPNGLQNFPDTLFATTAGVRGVLVGRPNTQHRVDFYLSRRCHSSGHGEGERYLASATVATDAAGKGSFSVSMAGLALERFVSATATVEGEGTSEFSACVPVTSGIAARVEIVSSRNPVRSRGSYDLTVQVTGGAGVPTGAVVLHQLRSGQSVAVASGWLTPSATQPDTAELLIKSAGLRLAGSSWGRVRLQAEYMGDALYAPTSSPEFAQIIYREKSDLDGNGLTDQVLCDSTGEAYLVHDHAGSFSGPDRVAGFAGRTLLGVGEFGLPAEPALVWLDGSGRIGGTAFAGGAPAHDFDIPLPAGLTVEALGSLYGDLKDDFVARDASGQHVAVLSGHLGGGQLQLLAPWAVGQPNAFLVEHVADFNGDGQLDWLLRHPVSQRHVIWLLDGALKVTAGGDPTVVPLGGRAVGTGDFDGDGRGDIVWALPNGDVEIVMQDGLTSHARLVVGLAAMGSTFLDTALFDDGQGANPGRASLVTRHTGSGRIEALLNTAVSAGLPEFGKTVVLPTGGLTDLSACR